MADDLDDLDDFDLDDDPVVGAGGDAPSAVVEDADPSELLSPDTADDSAGVTSSRASPLLSRFHLVVGFDSEYVNGADAGIAPPRRPAKPAPSQLARLSPAARARALDRYQRELGEYERNAVVCLSFHAYDPVTGGYVEGVRYANGLDARHRLYLSTFLDEIVMDARAAGILSKPLVNGRISLALVGHFTRADLSAFADWRSLKKRFDCVRGTYVTLDKPAFRKLRRARVLANIRLCDTRLLAPTGKHRLADLGDLVGYPKLSVPDVTLPDGSTAPGITRMDLALAQHPAAFDAYAVADAAIAVKWLVAAAADAEGKGLSRPPITLSSFGVAVVLRLSGHLLPDTLGRHPARGGSLGDFTAEAMSIQIIAADAFHGGRNEAYVHGFFRSPIPGRDFTDYDLKGAYATALAFAREIDWSLVERTTDLDRLAVLDVPAFATVEFSFPAGTRFPSLPVDTGDTGLVYPLSGIATVPGPELVVAINQGAKLRVIDGVRLHWKDANGPRPFVAFTQDVNRDRSAHKGTARELMAKERGNSVYGKAAQGVAAMKSKPNLAKLFDSRTGGSKLLDISKITSPWLAAYTSGIPRAVLSEILARLPSTSTVLSATTDGLLCDATPAELEAAASGPVGQLFASLRVLVDPNQSPDFIEVKHVATEALVPKTRGGFSTVLPPGQTKHILARAGHRLPVAMPPDQEIAEFERVFATRDAASKLPRKAFISPRDQWRRDGDLVTRANDVRVNFDYDLKREPVASTAADDPVHGTLNFQTRPWPTVADFQACRGGYERWRRGTGSILKTLADYHRFMAWRTAPRTRSGGRRTPFEQAVVVSWAKGLYGFPVATRGRRSGSGTTAPSLTEIAAIMTAAGIPDVTLDILRKARKREPDPQPLDRSQLTPLDDAVIARLEALAPPEAIDALHLLIGSPKTPPSCTPQGIGAQTGQTFSEATSTPETEEFQGVQRDTSSLQVKTGQSAKGGREIGRFSFDPTPKSTYTSELHPDTIADAAPDTPLRAAQDAPSTVSTASPSPSIPLSSTGNPVHALGGAPDRHSGDPAATSTTAEAPERSIGGSIVPDGSSPTAEPDAASAAIAPAPAPAGSAPNRAFPSVSARPDTSPGTTAPATATATSTSARPPVEIASSPAATITTGSAASEILGSTTIIDGVAPAAPSVARSGSSATTPATTPVATPPPTDAAAGATDARSGRSAAATSVASPPATVATTATSSGSSATAATVATVAAATSTTRSATLDTSDFAQLRQATARLAADYGIGPVALDLARKRAARFPGNDRERRVIALGLAVQKKLDLPLPDALAIVTRLMA